MGEIIAGAIVLGIIAGICYGIYLLCALVWNTTVCVVGWLDATFSIVLIIAILAFVAGTIVLIVGLVGDYDGCKIAVLKGFVPGIIVLGAIAGIIATYGMVELALFNGLPVEKLDDEALNRFMNMEITFEPNGTIGQIFGSVIFIGITLCVLSLVIFILWNLFSVDTSYGEIDDFEFQWQPLVGLFVPSIILGAGLFGWAYMIVYFVWDYPIFDAIIHGGAITAGFLGAIAALCCLLWKGADWGPAGDYGGAMAGFCLGLGSAIAVVAYLVYVFKILFIDLMAEYYLWIILGFVGLYLVLGVVYCLTRLHKIKEFVSDGIYYYWHH